ncbi:MAG: hypothetical protein FWG35_06055, partial [Spirochaetaceae bacterium]|nr:hypothetical protein [Spirochaetaceae bacterium]
MFSPAENTEEAAAKPNVGLIFKNCVTGKEYVSLLHDDGLFYIASMTEGLYELTEIQRAPPDALPLHFKNICVFEVIADKVNNMGIIQFNIEQNAEAAKSELPGIEYIGKYEEVQASLAAYSVRVRRKEWLPVKIHANNDADILREIYRAELKNKEDAQPPEDTSG